MHILMHNCSSVGNFGKTVELQFYSCSEWFTYYMKTKHRRKSVLGLESSQTSESAWNRNKSLETKSPRFRLQPGKGDESRHFSYIISPTQLILENPSNVIAYQARKPIGLAWDKAVRFEIARGNRSVVVPQGNIRVSIAGDASYASPIATH